MAEVWRRVGPVPKINVPANFFKLPGLERMETNNRRIAAALAPALERSSLKNSAVLAQMSGIRDTKMKRVAAIFKNVDFGASTGAAALISKQFTERQSRMWKQLGEQWLRIGQAFFPANLRDIEGIRLTDVQQVAFVEGVPLYAVPGRETAELLLQAESQEARRAILAERCSVIIKDCRDVVEAGDSAMLASDRNKVLEAAAALEAGFISPAQALIGSIVESLVWDYFGKDYKKREPFIPDKKGVRTPEAYDQLGVHEYIALAPIWQAFQKFDAAKGDPVPTTFSRNACAHTISDDQFTQVNALQGLMLASSILALMEEALQVAKAS